MAAVIMPIMILGYQMLTSSMEKLNPTARASTAVNRHQHFLCIHSDAAADTGMAGTGTATRRIGKGKNSHKGI